MKSRLESATNPSDIYSVYQKDPTMYLDGLKKLIALKEFDTFFFILADESHKLISDSIKYESLVNLIITEIQELNKKWATGEINQFFF